MSKLLSALLDADQPLFDVMIKDLETATAHTGVDIRLATEIQHKAYQVLVKLGLDPHDTTGEELYYALQSRVRRSDDHLIKTIGGTHDMPVDKLLPLIKKTADKAAVPRKAWVLKKHAARELLRSLPPPRVMKLMRHKSIGSMLKTENVFEIFGAVRLVEPLEWQKKLVKSYKQLQPSDFEERKIEIMLMPKEPWLNVAGKFTAVKHHTILHLKELGAVYILPVAQAAWPGISLSALVLALHYVNEIRTYSSYFKLLQMQPDFGTRLARTIYSDRDNHASLAGKPLHWRIIHRYYGNAGPEAHPELFEPHVQPEDLTWRSAEETLYEIDTELTFWRGLDYVGIKNGGSVIPFSLMDNIESYINNRPYGRHAAYHFRDSLWNELWIRYIGQKPLEHQVLRQLHSDLIAPDSVLAEQTLKAGV